MGFFRQITPFRIVCLLIAIAASWYVLSKEAQRRQKNIEEPAAQIQADENREPPPPVHTDPVTRAILPLPSSGKRFFFYVSGTTSRYYASQDINYETRIRPWQAFFQQHRLPVTTISDLNAAAPDENAVLVLPSAVALSNAEKQGLTAFHQRGGSILAGWAVGSRDQAGTFKGYGFLEQLFGIKVAGEIGKDDPRQFLNLSGDTPATIGYPAGRRIWLEHRSENWLHLGGGRQAGFYTDWMRSNVPGPAAAAVSFGEHGASRRHARWAVLGFPETSWGPETRQLYGMLENTLQWLAGGVAVSAQTWPLPYQSAFIVEMDTEEGFANHQALARMMDDIGAPATFYCITHEAQRHPALVRELGKRHELAFHGDLHDSFRGQPGTVQEARIERMVQEMTGILGQPVPLPGFRPPKEEYDRTTERILEAREFGHHAVDPNRTDARLPFLYPGDGNAGPRRLVILPRTQYDDFTLPMSGQSEAARTVLKDTLIGDFDMAAQLGGMGFLSIHSQHFGRSSLLAAVMPEFLQHAARHRKRVWIASAGQVAQWWRERAQLAYGTSGTSRRFTLDIAVTSPGVLGKGALIVTNPRGNVPVRVRSLDPARQAPRVVPVDDLRSAIVFDGMAPGKYAFEVLADPA